MTDSSRAMLPWYTAVGCVACGLLLGCGGGDTKKKDEKKPPPVVGDIGNVPPPVAAPIPAAAAEPVPPPAPSAPQETEEMVPVPDVYKTAGPAGTPGWVWRPGDPKTPDPRNRFAVASVGPNVSSTYFSVPPRPASAAATQKLPEGFVALAEFGSSPEGYPLRIKCEKDDSVMALVPAGTFVQGTDEGPPACSPAHGVYLDAYYIDVREVTASQYAKYREASRVAKKRVVEPKRTAAPQEPVSGINWGEAHFYALWAGKDLPTEAQWEKAARGPNGFQHPWGNGPYLWHKPRKPGQIDVVGSFPQDVSPYGVLDLAGNVREWCSDWYSEQYYQQLAAQGDTSRNPKGATRSTQRTVKGGDPRWLVWVRSGAVLTDRPEDVGFRCVLKLTAPGAEGEAEDAKKAPAKAAAGG